MKNVSILFTLFISTLSFSQDCMRGFILGEKVINASNQVGVVNGCNTEYILVKRNGYESKEDSRALYKSIRHATLASGQIIIDDSNYIGAVDTVYSNNIVEYTRVNYATKSFAQVSNLGLSIPTLSGIKIDDSVLDQSNYIGVVKQIFSNGKILYALFRNTTEKEKANLVFASTT